MKILSEKRAKDYCKTVLRTEEPFPLIPIKGICQVGEETILIIDEKDMKKAFPPRKKPQTSEEILDPNANNDGT